MMKDDIEVELNEKEFGDGRRNVVEIVMLYRTYCG
jgi:hypothetical protein